MKTLFNKPIDVNKLIALAGGGLIGAAIGWVISEVLVFQIFEKEKEDFTDLVEDLEYSLEEEPVVMKTTVSARKVKSGEGKIVTNYVEQFKKGKLLNPDPVDDAEEEIEHSLAEMAALAEEMEEEAEMGLPFVITEEKWTNPDNDWESVNLTYYTEDRVVTDEQDKIIKHPETILGPHALDSFGEGTTDPDTVFVQNNAEELFYEVCRVHGSYDEFVLGLPKQEPKKIPVKKSKDLIDEEARDAKKRRAKVKAKLHDETTEE